MLELSDVSFSYPANAPGAAKTILKDVSFSAPQGSVLGVVGGSGSGKTTLLRLITGLTSPGAGRIGGTAGQSHWLAPQTPVLIPFRTAIQNALLGREIDRLLTPDDIAKARAVLAELGLEDALGQVPGKLSGGMRRRVSIAQAVLSGRNLLLLDEPFAELDGMTRQLAEQAIWGRADQSSTVVIVSHDLDSICALCDQVLLLSGPPRYSARPVDIAPDLVALRGPKVRRAAPGFADAVAALQKTMLEAS